MISKNDVRDSILKECDIALHLYGKIPEGGFEYRPTAGQRNMLELLRYVSFCAIGGARAMSEGNFEGYQEEAQRVAELAPEEFPAAIEHQKQAITAFFDGFTDADMVERTATTPIGEEMPLGRALFELPLKWMVGYRMQLFLYCKQAGNTEIGTANCWAGMDWPQPESSE